jgi:two-component system, chemotaxis family, sensor kinase CheA
MPRDQYKYFRIEARELIEGLNQAVLEIERGGSRKDITARILRLAHTLKGASRVVTQNEIADFAHRIEDIFAANRNGEERIATEQLNRALGLLDAVSEKLASLDSQNSEPEKDAPRNEHPVPKSEEGFETVRVEIDEMDALLEGVGEASAQLTSLRRALEPLERARQWASQLLDQIRVQQKNESDRERTAAAKIRTSAEHLHSQIELLGRALGSGIDQIETEFTQVRDAANHLRLQPAAAVFPPLERAVRDAAQSLCKSVRFESSGGENRLDAHVLAALRDALLHIVRNAVAHGIESATERRAAGKSAEGRIQLRAEQRGTQVAFFCHDDGRGIDVESLRRIAVRRGLLSTQEEASFGLDEAVKIILKGGVSTAGEVDDVSGRGVGLDVVRETAERLRGTVSVRSTPGKGTTIEIRVPISLSSLLALEVSAGGIVAGIPLSSVRQTLRLSKSDITHSTEMDSVLLEDKVLPFANLSEALGKNSGNHSKRDSWSAIVVEGSSGAAAIGVDQLLGIASVVVRPLPSLAPAEVMIAGASLNAEGEPQLLLDPNALVAAAALGRTRPATPVPAKRAPVLVIDDSLTTRMLEQTILESAGYEVEVASSAEEGLEKARTKQYGLFLVDVEMPGMDGFEFVSRTRSDARLGRVPSILVTSRDAPEDRRRGAEAGAHAYIVKGEFDQGYLLRMTRELVG